MIKLKITDASPPNAIYIRIVGDDVYYYFDDDSEVIEIKSEQKNELKRRDRYNKKLLRITAINSSTVTTASGNTYQADETSQNRMARAVTVMDDVETIPWTVADNTRTEVTRAELREALRMAVMQQSSLQVLTDEK